MMKLTLLQRRFDRYWCIYVQKCVLGLVPNIGISVYHTEDHGNGLLVSVTSKKGMSFLKEHSFNVRAPKVFNSLPAELRPNIYISLMNGQ